MGQVILLGTPHGKSTFDSTELVRQGHLNWIKIVGALEQDFPIEPARLVKHSFVEDVTLVLGLMKEGRLKIKEMVNVIAPNEFKASYDGLLGPFEGRVNQKDEQIAVVV